MSKIVRYTSREGGDWSPWPADKESFVPSEDKLLSTVYTDAWAKTKNINGVLLHSFINDFGAVWDVLNGWRCK